MIYLFLIVFKCIIIITMYTTFFPNDEIVCAIKKIIELKLHYKHALQ